MGSKAMMERFAAVVEALAGEANVSVGQKGRRGFGSSALQVNGKIFAMVSSSGSFVVKLPKQRVEELEAVSEQSSIRATAAS
jgi:TfoX/Sxy family transcriptional regulator of competence genes